MKESLQIIVGWIIMFKCLKTAKNISSVHSMLEQTQWPFAVLFIERDIMATATSSAEHFLPSNIRKRLICVQKME